MVDEPEEEKGKKQKGEGMRKRYTLYQTIMEALGCSMIVLCLLDFARLALDIPLNIPGKLIYLYQKVKGMSG